MTDVNIDTYDEAYWTQVVQENPPDQAADELATFLGIGVNDPVARWAEARARIRSDRAVPKPCAYGSCVELWDPVDNKNTGGYGPADCPCDN
jgi:hypothetical protein